MNKQIEAMCKLGMSEEEIKQILEDDKRIDRGEKLFELDPEKEKVAKQARQADRKPTVYKLDNSEGKRSKKVDENKRFLIDFLVKTLSPEVDKEVEIINPEREFTFEYSGKKYKITLSAPRS